MSEYDGNDSSVGMAIFILAFLMVCCCYPIQKAFAVHMQRDLGTKFIEVCTENSDEQLLLL